MELREQGNSQFKASEWKEAILTYSKAIELYCETFNARLDSRTKSQLRKLSLTNIKSSFSDAVSSIVSAFSSEGPDKAAYSPSERLSPEEQLSVIQPHILYSNRSAAFIQLKCYEEAYEDAVEAAELCPSWPKSHFRAGEALFNLRRYDEALVHYYRALTKYSETTERRSRELIQKRIQFAAFALQDKTRNFRIDQLLCGRDIAASSLNPIKSFVFQYANSLQNFVYVIACLRTKKCVLVDVCWDVDGVLTYAENQGWEVEAAIVTHYHFDHVGGNPPKPFDQYGVQVEGIATLMRRRPNARVFIHKLDKNGLLESNPTIELDRITWTEDAHEVQVGETVKIKFLHTPGHTPGSQCLLVNGDRLFSGDTLFIGSVGRLDFPDSSLERMWESLTKIKALQGEIQIYAGHNYGGSFTTLEHEKTHNPVLAANNYQEFFRSISNLTGG